MNTVEVNEDEYLSLIEQNKKLQAKVDRYELLLFGMMKQVDKLLMEGQEGER